MPNRVLIIYCGGNTWHNWYVRETQRWHNQVLVDINKTGRQTGILSLVCLEDTLHLPLADGVIKELVGSRCQTRRSCGDECGTRIKQSHSCFKLKVSPATNQRAPVKLTLCYAYYRPRTAGDKCSPTGRADLYRTQSGGADLILCMTNVLQQTSKFLLYYTFNS